MPELPDLAVYLDALSRRILNQPLRRILIKSPFLLRTVEPPIESAEGRAVLSLERLGKRLVLGLEGDLFLVLHLMIAGRLLWKPPGAKPSGRIDLAAFQFDAGTLLLTEASPKKHASLHLLAGRGALRAHDPGGVDPLSCTPGQFRDALTRENRTLKRALASPHLFSGIGNAYSDEVLHAARLSPIQLTRNLADAEAARLHAATRDTLSRWTEVLRRDFGLDGPGPGRFPGPGEITAFRPGFAVHGRYGRPCPACRCPVQRIIHAENETNYCPACQTGGRILADRSLSRLLKDDWPRTLEEWEDLHQRP
ncbi:MAG: DNA-formamidopyrimidine glycosylase family protein [Phycisphaerales bacterium]